MIFISWISVGVKKVSDAADQFPGSSTRWLENACIFIHFEGPFGTVTKNEILACSMLINFNYFIHLFLRLSRRELWAFVKWSLRYFAIFFGWASVEITSPKINLKMRLFRDLNCLARLADLLKNRYRKIGRFFNSLVSGFSRHDFCWYTHLKTTPLANLQRKYNMIIMLSVSKESTIFARDARVY